MPIGDGGTMVPMIVLCFLLAGTFVAGSVAASAAFLAQRDIAGVCDGAALAAANAVDRSAVGSGGAAADSLPLSAASVAAAVGRYGRTQGAGDGAAFIAETDGTTVTVTCRRTVRIPFGALLGYGDGLDRTAVARARSPLG